MEDLRTIKVIGVRSLCWSDRLLKSCADVMFSIAMNDVKEVLNKIKAARKSLDSLETGVKKIALAQAKSKARSKK